MSENSSNFRNVFLAISLLIGGCLIVYSVIQKSAPNYNATVSGTVTIDGILAEAGTVTFHPVAGGQPAIGSIYSDGSYSLRSGQGDLSDPDGGGIASGGYVVTVAINAPPSAEEVVSDEADKVISVGGPPVPGPSLVAAKYRSKATSNLEHIVKPGANVFVLNLEAATSDDVAADDEEGNGTEVVPAETEPTGEAAALEDSEVDEPTVTEDDNP